MTLLSGLLRWIALVPLALVLSGCFPIDNGGADEEKDPHYLAGKSRFSSMDYDGAIAAYESALISNPKSAAAHLELGFLYEEKKGNYAAAIYHFERHLELKPESNMAEPVKQHVFSCKVELAKTVSFALVSRQVQDDIRRVSATNSALLEQIEALKIKMSDQAAEWSNKLALASQVSLPIPDLRSDFSEEPERATRSVERPPASVADRRSSPIERRPVVTERRPTPITRQVAPARFQPTHRATTAPRSHIVRSGDTLAAISKKYNVKLSALQMANPYVDARKLRAGQVLNIPGSRD